MGANGFAVEFPHGTAHLCWQVGLENKSVAYVLGRSLSEVEYWWSVATGLPVGTDPTEQELAARVAEIEGGWTDEIRAKAKDRQEFRESSAVVKGAKNSRASAYWRAKRKTEGASNGMDAG
jgi:hypothetical protein